MRSRVIRYHGQILDCRYGDGWPIANICTGFMLICITVQGDKMETCGVWYEHRADAVAHRDSWKERYGLDAG